jgi:hypothetical protein
VEKLWVPLILRLCNWKIDDVCSGFFRKRSGELLMKVRLEVTKAGRCLHQGVYEIDDNASFGAAFADVWVKIREQCAARATSIGALMDTMHESVVDELNGAEIKLQRI